MEEEYEEKRFLWTDAVAGRDKYSCGDESTENRICGKIGTLAGHLGKGEIAYEEALVLVGKMTVVEFCGG